MKTLILILTSLIFVGCAGSGSSDAAASTPEAPHVADNTEHTYTIVFYSAGLDGLQHPGTLHEVCNATFPGTRDTSANFIIDDVQTNGGIGCDHAKNTILEATNKGASNLLVLVTVDGVNLTAEQMGLPNQVLAAGKSFTFIKGY